MRLPNPKNKGDDLYHGEWNDLVAYARSNAVVDSPDIVAQHGAGGTALLLARRPGTSSEEIPLHPFQIYQSPADEKTPASADWRTFKVHTGRVSCETPDNDDDSDAPLSIVVPANTEEYWVWLKCKVRLRYHDGDMLREPIVESVTIEHGDDPVAKGWADFPSQTLGGGDELDGEEIDVRQVIGTIQTGSDSKSADDFRIEEIDQNVRSSLTIQFPVDYVLLKDNALEVWRKIIVFGPDNYVECPEPNVISSGSTSTSSQTSTSSATSSSRSSSRSSSSRSSSRSSSSRSSSRSSSSNSLSSSSECYSSSHNSSWGILSSDVGSQKTAIVPCRVGKRVRYVGLSCVEAPEVRFEDVMTVKLGRRNSVSKVLDKQFVNVCEPRSIVVVSAVASSPAVIGARIVRGRKLVVERRPETSAKPSVLEVTVKVSGIRRGFAGVRFAKFTKTQMLANNAFYAQAHKPAQPLAVRTRLVTGR